MATALAKASPAYILIASRTKSKVDPVLEAIRGIDPPVKAAFVQVDLSDQDFVRNAAQEILTAASNKIDVLIDSASVIAIKDYTVYKQGIEMQLSANHVGHFLLTNLLVPALMATTKHLGSRGVTCYAAHPESSKDTSLGSHLSMVDLGQIEGITKRNTSRPFVFVDPPFKPFEKIGASPVIAALDPKFRLPLSW